MHERLRATTRALHRRVERACPFGPGLERGAYVEHLARRLGFSAALERRLARFDGWSRAGLRCPADAGLIAADLRYFGWSTRDLAALPTCAELPSLSSFSSALGCAYVLEGARLGGRTIAPIVARTLGLEDRGVEFLAGDACELAARRRFAATLAAIDRHAATLDNAGRDEIIAGARETFAALARWLERGLTSRG